MTDVSSTAIAAACHALQADIDALAQSCGRAKGAARLMAVSKRQPVENIVVALAAGQRLFGENRVQEAQAHWSDLRRDWPDAELHLIGPLQTNKVKDAINLFDCIETIDRPGLADAVLKAMKKADRTIACYVQVNTGEEAQKGGVAPAGLDSLLAHCRGIGLTITGLMCIPPADEPSALHFALLKKLADRHGLRELSMGMSADYARAVPLGATIVRVGSALFGARDG